MAKKPTLPPPSASAKPAPPKPTPPKPTQPAASAGKPNLGKPTSGKPAPGKPVPAKPTPGGKPVKPTGGATSSSTITKPGVGSASTDPSTAKPVREFKGDSRKPLTPINVRPILDELGSPVYRRIKQRIDQQPGQVESALRSSRSPDAAFRKIFGTWGRNPEMEAKAIEAAKRNGLFKGLGYDVRGSGSAFFAQVGEEVDDPCSEFSGNPFALEQCYLSQLSAYGVEIMDTEDLRVRINPNNPSAGSVSSFLPNGLDDFSPEQLAIILQGVQSTGERLSSYVSTIVGREITPEQAFQMVYGAIRFGYDEERDGVGLTVPTGTATNLRNPIYILLDDSSFGNDGQIGFNQISDSFVVVHELGHALASRVGLLPSSDTNNEDPSNLIDQTPYVQATGGIWNRVGENNQVRLSEEDATRAGLEPARDASDQVIEGVYVLPLGGYFINGFQNSTVDVNEFFFNEFGQRIPDEGFADAYAFFVTQPEFLQQQSLVRFDYIDTNISSWIAQVLTQSSTR